jgi:hypothetical protein
MSVILLCTLASMSAADDFPKLELRNAHTSMTVYRPDTEGGFYRGRRFDWSGVIEHVTFNTHKIFGKWKDKHDSAGHDDITGPAEEFRTPLGYDDAKEGGTLLKVGVGTLVKPAEKEYRFTHAYAIKYAGQWKVTRSDDEIVFEQGLLTNEGYGYKYTKTLKLQAGLAGFSLRHELQNVGEKPIKTDWYNHNFYNVNADPIGPNYSLSFPFDAKAKDTQERFDELIRIEARAFRFANVLDRGTVFGTVTGAKDEAAHHAFAIYHTPTRVNLTMTADVPMSKLLLWGIKGAICPEPYIDISLRPGESKTWTLTYTITSGPRNFKW